MADVPSELAFDGTVLSGLPAYDTRATGFKTYEKVRVLDGGSAFIERAFYYDERGRLIQTVEKNLVGVSRYSTVYDFMGNPLTTHEKHAVTGGSSYEVTGANVYDHRNRLLSTETNFTRFSNQILISQQTAKVRYAYDELGRLLGKQYGEGEGAFSSVTDYNIQGWMTSQKSPHFRTELTYFQNGVQSYTGNILSAKSVMPTSEDELDRRVQTYNYSYDMFGRLLTGNNSEGYGETVLRGGGSASSGYDLNGNILSMIRTGSDEIAADFTYYYSGNKLMEVRTPGSSSAYNFTYDRNGNLVEDGRKDLVFKYNLLNLVSEVTAIASGDDKATYSYSADGMKLRVRGSADDGYDYLGSITLVRGENEDISGVEALFADGMFRTGETTQETMFFEKDHLGSVRAVVNSDGETLATNNYLPFGTRHTGGMRDDNIRYKFNGKEEQTTGSLNLLDFGARMYDNELGRWFVQDPLAEKFIDMSPYNYCLNNPLKFIDPTGMFSVTITDPDEIAKFLADEKDRNKKKRAASKFPTTFGQEKKDDAGSEEFDRAPDYAYGRSISAMSNMNFNFSGNSNVHNIPKKPGSPDVTPKDPGSISPYEPNFFEKMKEGGWIPRLAYNFMNDTWVMLQSFVVTHPANLDGSIPNSSEKLESGVNGLLNVSVGIKGGAPRNINASQFNKLSPSTRGIINGKPVNAATNGGLHIRSYNYHQQTMKGAIKSSAYPTTALPLGTQTIQINMETKQQFKND